MKLQRKRNRLEHFNYKGNYRYFLTICIQKGKEYFKRQEAVNLVLEYLKTSAAVFKGQVLAYCFMPDHLHQLILGNEGFSLLKFVKDFKQKSGYHFKQMFKETLWQKSYYDHVLRQDEDLIPVMRYIFENPVRKGLVCDFRDYPYLGSLVFDRKDLDELEHLEI